MKHTTPAPVFSTIRFSAIRKNRTYRSFRPCPCGAGAFFVVRYASESPRSSSTLAIPAKLYPAGSPESPGSASPASLRPLRRAPPPVPGTATASAPRRLPSRRGVGRYTPARALACPYPQTALQLLQQKPELQMRHHERRRRQLEAEDPVRHHVLQVLRQQSVAGTARSVSAIRFNTATRYAPVPQHGSST